MRKNKIIIGYRCLSYLSDIYVAINEDAFLLIATIDICTATPDMTGDDLPCSIQAE